MLIASMNPCPCGYFNHPEKECSCAPGVVKRYLNRISGPLLDRIDLHVEVTPVPLEQLTAVPDRPAEKSRTIALRVQAARRIQEARFSSHRGIYCNAQMPARLVREHCKPGEAGSRLLRTAMDKLQLSARAYDRILKVARTVADLEGAADVGPAHLAEAINFRTLDRGSWGERS